MQSWHAFTCSGARIVQREGSQQQWCHGAVIGCPHACLPMALLPCQPSAYALVVAPSSQRTFKLAWRVLREATSARPLGTKIGLGVLTVPIAFRPLQAPGAKPQALALRIMIILMFYLLLCYGVPRGARRSSLCPSEGCCKIWGGYLS